LLNLIKNVKIHKYIKKVFKSRKQSVIIFMFEIIAFFIIYFLIIYEVVK
jgi:hypothetical protein